MKISNPWSRKGSASRPGLSAGEALAYLTADLRATLASLHQAPKSVAEAAVQLLPFGSRLALQTLCPPLAIAGEPLDDEGHQPLTLTPFAYDVMAAAAAEEESDASSVARWEERAQQAVDEVTRQAHQ